MIGRLAAMCLVALGVSTAVVAQRGASAAPDTGAAVLAGRVVDGTTGQPMPGAIVTVDAAVRPANTPLGAGPVRPGTLADSQGRFVFEHLTAGTFVLRAQGNDAAGAFGQTRPGGSTQTIVLAADDRVLDATIRAWRNGSVTGIVVDDTGEPIVGATVTAIRRAFVGGRARFANGGLAAMTDDRGIYRIGGLASGDYVVGVSFQLATFPISVIEDPDSAKGPITAGTNAPPTMVDRNDQRLIVPPNFPSIRVGAFAISQSGGPVARVIDGRVWALPSTYAPSSASVDRATIVTVAAGEDRTGVDIAIKSMPVVTISGTVTGPKGPFSLGVRLWPADTDQFRSPDLVAQTQAVSDASGRFTIMGVFPGQYTIGPPTLSSVWGSTPVTVGDRDVTDVALAIHPMLTVTGRIEFDGNSPHPPVNQVRLSFERADSLNLRPAINISGDGALKTTLAPGRYFLRLLSGPQTTTTLGLQIAGWTLKSAMLNGHDVIDEAFAIRDADLTGLIVTLTDQPTTLSGVVHDAQGAADISASVLVFPTDKSTWIDFGSAPRRLGLFRVDRKGTFSMSGLPAGEYFLVAIPDEMAGAWQNPGVLESASRLANRVRIADGQSYTVDLRTARW